jgi:hypothetical protein
VKADLYWPDCTGCGAEGPHELIYGRRMREYWRCRSCGEHFPVHIAPPAPKHTGPRGPHYDHVIYDEAFECADAGPVGSLPHAEPD